MFYIIKVLIVILLGLFCFHLSEWAGKKDSSGGITGIFVLSIAISVWIFVICSMK